MLKKSVQIIATICCVAFMIKPSFSYAQESISCWDKMDADLMSRVKKYSLLFLGDDVPEYSRLIRSPGGKTDYLYAEIGDGFVLVDLSNGFIAEAGHEKIYGDESKDYIYNGLQEYYEVEDGVAYHIKGDRSIPVDEMEEFVPATQTISLADCITDIQAVPELPAFKYVSLPRFNYALTGEYKGYGYCGPLATVNFLMYMDAHYYSNTLIPSNLKNNLPTSLLTAVDDLIYALYPDQNYNIKWNGTEHYHLRDAINLCSYLSNKDLHVLSGSWNLSTYLSAINSNRPALIGYMADSIDDPSHWMTGIGFYISQYYTIEAIQYYDDDGKEKSVSPNMLNRMVYKQ